MKKRTIVSALRRDVDAVADVFKYADVGVPGAIIGWMHGNIGGLVDNWSQLAPMLGIPDVLHEKLGNILSERELIQTVSRAWENQQGYVVRVEGKCHTYERRTKKAYLYDETPDEIKYQLGVLKMQDPGTYVRDCGYRHDDVTFYVMEKNDE
jgi:hypothetical protein